jgi:hypothetical protein
MWLNGLKIEWLPFVLDRNGEMGAPKQSQLRNLIGLIVVPVPASGVPG